MADLKHEMLLPELSVIAVREALATSSSSRTTWQRSVLHALDDLELSFAAHIERAERPGGFFDEAHADAPRAVHALKELKHDHKVLVDDIAAARHTVVVCDPDRGIDAAALAVAETLNRVEAHLHAANSLSMDIANRDLGGD